MLALVGLPGVAHAEWKKVSRQELKLLLAAPLLENGRESYQYGGWDASGGDQSCWTPRSCPQRARHVMQVYFNRLAALHQWGEAATSTRRG